MHKNPHQNAGNGIKETLFFKGVYTGALFDESILFINLNNADSESNVKIVHVSQLNRKLISLLYTSL